MKAVFFLDTCVWLDLAKSPNDEPILSSIEELVESKEITLIIPQIVKDEFSRNKDRVKESARQRLTQEFKKVRKVIETFGEEQSKSLALDALDEVNHRLPIISDKVVSSISRIEKLFSDTESIEIPTSTFVAVGQRALDKLAPFHRQKNSFADALLMEVFYNESEKLGAKKFYFVTHNTSDFSSLTDDRKIHPDYNSYFDGDKRRYSINIVAALKEVDPTSIDEKFFEHDWSSETRSLTQILSSIDEYEQKIWYNRHCLLASRVRKGKIKIVKKSSGKYKPGEILEEIWEGARKAAEKVEAQFPGDLGPWSDFEWGMINGKLSALRWLLGEEWDMLDT